MNPLYVLKIQLCIIEEGERICDNLHFCDFLKDGKCQKFRSLDEDENLGRKVLVAFAFNVIIICENALRILMMR